MYQQFQYPPAQGNVAAPIASVEAVYNNTQVQKEIQTGPRITPYTELLTLKDTDMDHFPYYRFFRGDRFSKDPIVFDREAGYHSRGLSNNGGFEPNKEVHVYTPDASKLYCFQPPCGTIFPCFPPAHIPPPACVNISI